MTDGKEEETNAVGKVAKRHDGGHEGTRQSKEGVHFPVVFGSKESGDR
jgi:hypothetical protein